ncbi:Ecotropic viral integration site 5 protein [Manis javanica]|nr:Ecotropic viral integration site 5 protein [Manis javanica]
MVTTKMTAAFRNPNGKQFAVPECEQQSGIQMEQRVLVWNSHSGVSLTQVLKALMREYIEQPLCRVLGLLEKTKIKYDLNHCKALDLVGNL